ncbi:uncharacterized protein LOC114582546 [Podarcis muralis]
MSALGEMQIDFLVNNEECSEEKISADIFDPPAHQEDQVLREPQPSCSGEHLKATSKSKTKGRELHKPSFPWKFLFPKRGVSKLIFQVVASGEKRHGVSLQALKKSVAATGYDLEKKKSYFKRVLRALVAKGVLRKLTGRGLTGCYAISRMMMRLLRRRSQKKRRRGKGKGKGKGKALPDLKPKQVPKKKKRKSRKRRKKKTKRMTSKPSDLQSPMLMTGSHS